MQAIKISQHAQEKETDANLLAQIQRGNQQAFETFVIRYQDAIYRYATTFLDREQAADTVQEVWIQFYVNNNKLNRQFVEGEYKAKTLKSWLYQVTRNRCLDKLRHNKLRPALNFSDIENSSTSDIISLLQDIPDPMPQPDLIAYYHDVQQWLHELINQLPTSNRDVVWLRYKEELSFADIGRCLRIPKNAAKVRYYRSCIKIRQYITNT